MHVYVRTIRITKYIQRNKKKENPIGGQVSGWTCRTRVQNFRVYLLETAWTLTFGAEHMCILRSCL